MGFIRHQEERLAARLLRWQYEKHGQPLPGEGALNARAAQLVDEAHRIGSERGRNILEILHELVADLMKSAGSGSSSRPDGPDKG
jgi:hypothetical protein